MRPCPDRHPHLPGPPALPVAVALGTLLLAALTIWAAFAEVEIVVTAPARARPADGAAELRAPEDRSVARVLAQEGDRVRRGQVIVVLASDDLDAEADSVNRALAAGSRERADTRSVLAWLDGDPAGAGSARAMARIREMRGRLGELDGSIRALGAELTAARRRVAAGERLLAIDEARQSALRAAAVQGAVSRFDYLRMREETLSRQAEVSAGAGRVAVLEQRLAAQRESRAGVEAEQRRTLLTSLESLAVDLAGLRARRTALDARRDLRRVAASKDGVLDRVLVQAGDFVRRGEPLAVVVPDAGAVVFETRIAPRQMAFLHRGQRCRIKLDALPFARYGALDCTLERLGRDAVGADDGSGYYVARVRPASRDLLVDGVPIRLRPGATGRVDIIAGKRTVLGFFTDPLRRFGREALRER